MISYPQIWSRVLGVFAAQRARPPVVEDRIAPETEEVVARASESGTRQTVEPRSGRQDPR
jgi:hypothetical protein